jgi:hypothetical protein
MSVLSTTRRRVAAAASGVVVAGAAGAFALTSGAFASSTPTPPAPKPPAVTPSTSTSVPSAGRPGAPNGHRKAIGRRHGLLARTDYATIEVFRHGHWETIVLDRGDVTAVSTSRITIRRPDGVSVTIALAPTTKYRGVGAAGSLKTNRPASVISAAGSALRVVQVSRPALQSRPAK